MWEGPYVCNRKGACKARLEGRQEPHLWGWIKELDFYPKNKGITYTSFMSGGAGGRTGSDVILKSFFGCYGQWFVVDSEWVWKNSLGNYCRDQIEGHTPWTRIVRQRCQQIWEILGRKSEELLMGSILSDWRVVVKRKLHSALFLSYIIVVFALYLSTPYSPCS